MATAERAMTVCDRCKVEKKATWRYLIKVEKQMIDGRPLGDKNHIMELCVPCGTRLERFVGRGVDDAALPEDVVVES